MTEFDASIVLAGIPLLFAAFGGLIAERSGVLNVGLEGLMLFGAFFGAWAAAAAGNDFVGLLGALGATLVLGVLLGWIMVSLRADQVVVGIAFNIVAFGATSYFFRVITNGDISKMSSSGGGVTRIPGLASIPWIGPFFDQHWLVYVGYAIVPVGFLALFRTGLGIRLRACGEFAEGARASGINVVRMRIATFGLSGMLAGTGGAYLVLGGIHQFTENMTSGQGYIALAVIILGRWRPLGAAAGALLFALAEALSFRIQSGGTAAPAELFFAMPYIVTLLAVAISGRRVRPPAEEGRPLYLPT
jgi:ABC-type uncharacterized transport system permease subunit